MIDVRLVAQYLFGIDCFNLIEIKVKKDPTIFYILVINTNPRVVRARGNQNLFIKFWLKDSHMKYSNFIYKNRKLPLEVQSLSFEFKFMKYRNKV